MSTTTQRPAPQRVRAGDLAPTDLGACAWDPKHNDKILSVSSDGALLEWGPRKPENQDRYYPPAWVPAKTLLQVHSGRHQLDFIVHDMKKRQLGLGFLVTFEGGLLDWGFFGYLGAGELAWAFDPSTGDVVNRTASIEGGLPTLPDGRGVVTLELDLPRDREGAARFLVLGRSSKPIALPEGTVVTPAACLLSEGQRVSLAPLRTMPSAR